MFPTEVLRSGVKEYWRDTMLKANGPEAEIFVYGHVQFPDYVAFTHPNLNVDNAYFWRDEKDVLHNGVLDWGGFAQTSLASALWRCLECADFDQLNFFLPHYLSRWFLLELSFRFS